jgi:ribosomal protein S24E
MEMQIIDHKDNPLLGREEYWIKLDHTGKPTPTRIDILSFVAKELKSKEELVIIDKIFSSKGEASSKIKVFVYKKKESIPKYQLEKMKRRMKKIKTKTAEKPKEKQVEGQEKPEAAAEEAEKPEETAEGQQEEAKPPQEQKPEETKQEEEQQKPEEKKQEQTEKEAKE